MTIILGQEKPPISEVLFVSETLAHHGVKGMKWGIRKDRPTSGSSSSSSTPPTREQRREIKAKTLEARAIKADIRVGEIKQELKDLPVGIRTAYTRNNLVTQLNQNTAYRDQLRKDAAAVRQGHMTSNQKKLLIGGLAAAAIIGYVGYQQMNQSGQFNSLKLRGAAFLHGDKFEFAKDESLARKMSPDQVLNKVVKGLNPNYDKPGGQMNCRRCSFAYELRRRGYDVVSTPSDMGWGQSETGLINAVTTGGRNVYRRDSLSQMVVGSSHGIRGRVVGDRRMYPHIETASIKDAFDGGSGHSVFSALGNQPDGARGEIVFNFRQFGHSLSYERFGSKTVIFDTQKGTKYDADTIHKFFEKWGAPENAEVTRLDNVDLDLKFLSRWATNKKKGG